MNNKLILKSYILFTLFFVGTLNFSTRENVIEQQAETVVLEQTNDETEQNKARWIRIAKQLGSGLKSASMPFRRGIGKGVENFTTKVTGKAIPVVIGCVAYWLLYGRHNGQSFFLPITSVFKLVKELAGLMSNNETVVDSSLRRFLNWFGIANTADNLASEPNFGDRAIAVTFLLLAGYLS